MRANEEQRATRWRLHERRRAFRDTVSFCPTCVVNRPTLLVASHGSLPFPIRPRRVQGLFFGFGECILGGFDDDNPNPIRGGSIWWLIFYSIQFSWLAYYPVLITLAVYRAFGPTQ